MDLLSAVERCLSVRLKLKISATTEPNGLYSSGNIPIGPVMVLSYFPGGWDTPNRPPKNKNKNVSFLKTTFGTEPLEDRGEPASKTIKNYQSEVLSIVFHDFATSRI